MNRRRLVVQLCLGAGVLTLAAAMAATAPAQTEPVTQSGSQAGSQPSQPAAQTPETRDLKTIDLSKKNAPVSIPRSYALVVGIAKYKNLPDSAQLAYPNRDAE